MDLETLHEIDEELTKSDVAALKFLCLDFLHRKRLETVKDAKDLFLRLNEQTLLEDPFFLAELLHTIGRFDLLKHLKTNEKEVSSRLQVQTDSSSRISPYRKMLYKLSEDTTQENLSSIKFLLVNLPKAKLKESTTLLEILAEMEKMNMLGKDNLGELEKILDKCDKQLANQVQTFRNWPRTQEQGSSLQEASSTFPQQEEPMEISNEPRSLIDTSPRGRGSLDAVVTDAESPSTAETREETADFYSLKRRPRGYCLIINNYNFENARPLGDRKGTHRDVDALTRVFSTLHFDVETKTDLCSSDMLNVTKEYAEEIHFDRDAFVCCILSHGLKGTVLGTDGKEVQIRDLTQPFTQCMTLVDKPKLFFIQACQGKQYQRSIFIQADGNEDENKEVEEAYEEDAQAVQLRSIPFGADFLIAMATVESYLSFRHINNGSIFIQELCKQLENGLQRRDDILSVLTRVNREVSFQSLNGKKQMPEPRYTLTKKLVFTLD